MHALVDYYEDFANENAVIAQGQGSNFIVIRKLDKLFRRGDGKKALYELEYRWLSQECRNERDQCWACVQGSEFSYWQRKEIESLLRKIQKVGDVNVFDHFFLH